MFRCGWCFWLLLAIATVVRVMIVVIANRTLIIPSSWKAFDVLCPVECLSIAIIVVVIVIIIIVIMVVVVVIIVSVIVVSVVVLVLLCTRCIA